MKEIIPKKNATYNDFIPIKKMQDTTIPNKAFLELVIIVTYKMVIEIDIAVIFLIRILLSLKTRKYENGHVIANHKPA